MKFWMVVCAELSAETTDLLEKRGPRFIHGTLEDAEREAERLALKYAPQEFAVLEAVAIVSASPSDVMRQVLRVPRWVRSPAAPQHRRICAWP